MTRGQNTDSFWSCLTCEARMGEAKIKSLTYLRILDTMHRISEWQRYPEGIHSFPKEANILFFWYPWVIVLDSPETSKWSDLCTLAKKSWKEQQNTRSCGCIVKCFWNWTVEAKLATWYNTRSTIEPICWSLWQIEMTRGQPIDSSGLQSMKRSLMAWVVVIPKEGWARPLTFQKKNQSNDIDSGH